MKRVLIVAVLLAAGLVTAIALKIRAQRDALAGPPSGSAVLESEGVDLSARMSARVVRVLVEEGASVQAGAALFELACDEPQARLAEAQARLAAARAQAESARAQAEGAQRQSQAARASINAASAQINALDTQRAAAEREAQRVEAMGEYAAAARQDQARSTATGLGAQADAARATQTASSRQAAAASSQALAVAAQAAAADRSVDALLALVRTAEVAVAECRISAPSAGVVERLYYDPGELVLPGAVVARVIDPGSIKATFYLPNADLAAAKVGLSAKVTADALPDVVFEAHVRRIGLEAEFTPRNIQTRSDRDRLVYPIELRIPNPEHKLRAGMNVNVELREAVGSSARAGVE
jgi:HlyD family secretion protein